VVDQTGGFVESIAGRRVLREELLSVCLAGFAVNDGYGRGFLDFRHVHGEPGDDIHEARRLIAAEWWLRVVIEGRKVVEQSVDDALCRHFLCVGERLVPYEELIVDIGGRLANEGRLSARAVAAMCREYAKKQKGDA
jgi:hypothetical protein